VPTVVALRGDADGIWASETNEFRLTSYRRRTNASAIVVRDRKSEFGSDKVGRILPKLFDEGMSGYAKTFDGQTWRVYSLVEHSE